MSVASMQDKLLDRYLSASRELYYLMFPESYGVSERFQIQLGFKQISKTATTIDAMITQQMDFLMAAHEDLEAGKSLTDEKRQVFQGADRALRRAASHVQKAMNLIQASSIYQIETSEEAKRLKVQQRRVSAFKIVEKLAGLLELVEKKRENLKNRAQKIVLTATFQGFRSRSPSAKPFKSRSRSAGRSKSRSAGRSKSRSAGRSKSRSATTQSAEFIPGIWKREVRIKDDVVEEFVNEDGDTEYLVRLPEDEVERLKRDTPQIARFRMGYNF